MFLCLFKSEGFYNAIKYKYQSTRDGTGQDFLAPTRQVNFKIYAS